MNLNDSIFNDLEEQENLIPRPRYEKKLHYSLEKTYSWIQEEIAKSEPFLNWTSDTYFKDRQRLYAMCFAYLKRKDEPSLISALRWATSKRVHVRALMKVLNKK